MFFVITFLFLILGRANTSLLGFEILNPDETQMMANAVGLSSRGFDITYFDGNSSGVINSLILTWPNIFNLDITFLSTRLTAILLLSVIIYFTFKISEKYIAKIFSFLLCFPLIIFFSFTKDPDFLHYSSELISTLIIVLAYWILLCKEKKNQNNILYYFIPMILSLVFFCKIQFGPVAILIFFLMIIDSVKNNSISNTLLLILSFSVMPIFILSTYYFNNSLQDFFINYYQYPKDYISVMNEAKVPETTNILEERKFEIENTKYLSHIILNSALHFFYIYLLILVYISPKIFSKYLLRGFINKHLFFITIVITSITICILIPGRYFRHYLISLMPFIPIFLSILIGHLLKEDLIKKFNLKVFLAFLIMVFSFSLIMENKKFYSKKYTHTKFELEEINFNNPELFNFLLLKKNEKIYIWGWMPKWYVLGGPSPASRSTISEKLIEENTNKNYYRQRLVKDLTLNKPNLIIDFVRPGSFKHMQSNDRLEKFKELKKITQNEYKILYNPNKNCPTFYLSKKNFSNFYNKNINYSFNNNKYMKMNDLSVTEDVCDDKYNFTNSDDDEFYINFDKEEKIKDIYVLSSKNNETKSFIDVKLLKDEKIIYSKKVTLRKYPYWNKLKLDKKLKAESVLINVKNLKLKNYGINEIKLYKD